MLNSSLSVQSHCQVNPDIDCVQDVSDDISKQSKTFSNRIKELEKELAIQEAKNKELEHALSTTTKSRNLLERLLQQELTDRTRLETEIANLEQTNSRLKSNIQVLEKNKSNIDEIMRVLNATLMERETEVSILKLKLTRLQAKPKVTLNPDSSASSNKQDRSQAFISAGRSNSEFDRNSYARASMMAEVATRSSVNQLKASDRDASIWAAVPEELTPSKRPSLLIRGLDSICDESGQSSIHGNNAFHCDESPNIPFARDRRYKTLPRSMKSFLDERSVLDTPIRSDETCPSMSQATKLDHSNASSKTSDNKSTPTSTKAPELMVKSTIEKREDDAKSSTSSEQNRKIPSEITATGLPPIPIVDEVSLTPAKYPVTDERVPSSPVKLTSGIKKIFDKFRRSDSNQSHSRIELNSPNKSPFKRGANRSTLIGSPGQMKNSSNLVQQAINFQTNKPFAEWDTEMIEKWLTMIGLSMYAAQCKRWVKCGAHIMFATPAEVDKGLGITNHLHSKKLRLAISELNGDCDKVTKAAAKLDYLWVARWLDDIGLPQHKEAFINARVDGRVLNYLTVNDLISLHVKSLLHHSSIRCGIRVLRSINFDLQLLKRRATAEELETMNTLRRNAGLGREPSFRSEITLSNQDVLPLWTCHRLMEWLRMIDFAEFASNLRGSGVHGGILVYEPGFNVDTLCILLSLPTSRTLLRRHLTTFFNELIGKELAAEKIIFKEDPTNIQLDPGAEIKSNKKNSIWKFKSSRVAQDTTDEYLCPMYPADPPLINVQKSDGPRSRSDVQTLALIPESLNI